MLNVTFLGTASVLPEAGGDTICHVVNGKILFDTGWSAPLRLPVFGIDPLAVTHLLFTHFHHDHYVALPQMLLQRQLMAAKTTGTPPLIIGGPAEDLETIVGLAQAFLQESRFPGVSGVFEVLPLNPGDRLTVDDLVITVGKSSHPVAAHSYRVEDTQSGKVIGITGDTAFIPELVTFHQGVDLLITEASFGERPAPEKNPFGHMGGPDAARLALETGAKRLALTHASTLKRHEALAVAIALFPETFWPKDGERVVLAE